MDYSLFIDEMATGTDSDFYVLQEYYRTVEHIEDTLDLKLVPSLDCPYFANHQLVDACTGEPITYDDLIQARDLASGCYWAMGLFDPIFSCTMSLEERANSPLANLVFNILYEKRLLESWQ